jgi:hypothetical protein
VLVNVRQRGAVLIQVDAQAEYGTKEVALYSSAQRHEQEAQQEKQCALQFDPRWIGEVYHG